MGGGWTLFGDRREWTYLSGQRNLREGGGIEDCRDPRYTSVVRWWCYIRSTVVSGADGTSGSYTVTRTVEYP